MSEAYLYGRIGSLAGVRIIQNPLLTIGPFEDWSDVRSPGRAKRRRARGYRQRIRFYRKPDPSFYRTGDTIVCHPASYAALRAHLATDGGRTDV